MSRADTIATVVIEQFNKLPPKRKPVVRSNGLREWVPLSGIVAEVDGEFICLALATGMRCLPASKLAASKGVAVHDWHAEVLAIRAFNRYVLDECYTVIHGVESRILEKRRASSINSGHSGAPFEMREGVRLHMYCSEAPCGDASMELVMADQTDSAPWEEPESTESVEMHSNPDGAPPVLPGRAFFSRLGIVRRKPARRDAEPTLSKSCSDKLALKQCSSLLSSLVSLYVDVAGAFINTLVLPVSRYSQVACDRSFSDRGRMAPIVASQWHEGYGFKQFMVQCTEKEFGLSRKVISEQSRRISGSNLAAVWTRSGLEETLLGGVMQGRRPFDARGASGVSRLHMWRIARALADDFGYEDSKIRQHVSHRTYKDVKNGPALAARRQVKAETRASALIGWIIDDRDSDFEL